MFALKILFALTVFVSRYHRAYASSTTKPIDSFKDLWTGSSKVAKDVSILQLEIRFIRMYHLMIVYLLFLYLGA